MTEALDFPLIGLLNINEPPNSDVPATLNFDSGDGLTLEIPFGPGGWQKYSRWFQPDQKPSSRMLFNAHQTSIHLIGCRNAGYEKSNDNEYGVVTLTADYAIDDIDRYDDGYSAVHAFRSQIVGLHEFVGWEASKVHIDSDDQGLTKKVTIATVNHNPIVINKIGDMALSVQQYWRGGQDNRSVSSIRETTWIETTCPKPSPLKDHLDHHLKMRDLIALAYWQPTDFAQHRVCREDRPQKNLAGHPIEKGWRELYTTRTRRSHARGTTLAPEQPSIPPGVDLETLGVEGIRKWLEVHDEWKRAINPLLNLEFAGPTYLELALMQASVAMEAYGYLAAIKAGTGAKKAKNTPYKKRVEDAIAELSIDFEDLVQEPVSDWAQRAKSAFMGVKHADRPISHGTESWLVTSTLILLLRMLLFRRCGLSDDALEKMRQRSTWWQLRLDYKRLHR